MFEKFFKVMRFFSCDDLIKKYRNPRFAKSIFALAACVEEQFYVDEIEW